MAKKFSDQAFVSLKLIGFSESDKAKFESILVIAEFRLDVPWRIVDSAETDFYLLSSHLRLQFDKDPLLQSLPRKRCIFCAPSSIDINDNELIIANDSIPSLSILVPLLNQLAASEIDAHVSGRISAEPQPIQLKLTPSVPSETPSISNAATPLDVETDYFDPQQCFVGQLLSSKDGIRYFSFKKALGLGKLYIHPEKKIYYSNNKLELLNGFFSSVDSLLTQSLSEQELQQEIENEELKPQPLSNLIWYSTFRCSQGRVIKGHNENDIVYLKRWPDINLPGCRKLIKLAAYMQSNAVDLMVTQQQTGIPIEQIYDFFNACKVIGLIEYAQQTDIHEKKLDDEKRQLFAKIGKRLNQPTR